MGPCFVVRSEGGSIPSSEIARHVPCGYDGDSGDLILGNEMHRFPQLTRGELLRLLLLTIAPLLGFLGFMWAAWGLSIFITLYPRIARILPLGRVVGALRGLPRAHSE